MSHTAASATRDEPGEKELLGRLTIKWTPTDRLTATFKASGDYNMVNNNSWNYVTFYCPTGVSQLGGGECGRDFITKQNRMPTDIAADYQFAKKDRPGAPRVGNTCGSKCCSRGSPSPTKKKKNTTP